MNLISILAFVLTFIVFWLGVALFINYSKFKPEKLEKYKGKDILAVFAHPDDEGSCAGTLYQLSKVANVRLVTVTKGERGNKSMKMDLDLKKIREKELIKSASKLKVQSMQQYDLGDNELKKKHADVRSILTKEIESFNPDIVITHDLSGMYGHPDHMTISKELTELNTEYEFKLWYTTLSQRLARRLKINNKAGTKDRGPMPIPNICFNTGLQMFIKFSVFASHKSQFGYSVGSIVMFLPMLLYLSWSLREFFYEV